MRKCVLLLLMLLLTACAGQEKAPAGDHSEKEVSVFAGAYTLFESYADFWGPEATKEQHIQGLELGEDGSVTVHELAGDTAWVSEPPTQVTELDSGAWHCVISDEEYYDLYPAGVAADDTEAKYRDFWESALYLQYTGPRCSGSFIAFPGDDSELLATMDLTNRVNAATLLCLFGVFDRHSPEPEVDPEVEPLLHALAVCGETGQAAEQYKRKWYSQPAWADETVPERYNGTRNWVFQNGTVTEAETSDEDELNYIQNVWRTVVCYRRVGMPGGGSQVLPSVIEWVNDGERKYPPGRKMTERRISFFSYEIVSEDQMRVRWYMLEYGYQPPEEEPYLAYFPIDCLCTLDEESRIISYTDFPVGTDIDLKDRFFTYDADGRIASDSGYPIYSTAGDLEYTVVRENSGTDIDVELSFDAGGRLTRCSRKAASDNLEQGEPGDFEESCEFSYQ